MELGDAVRLISNNAISASVPQHWADLGCGSGTFTRALASLLAPQSLIYALDTDRRSLAQIPTTFNDVTIQKQEFDFVNQPLPFNVVNGMLLANSFHYVKDKEALIVNLKSHLAKDGSLLLVEYDTAQGNQWVPYPLTYDSLGQLFKNAGFNTIRKLGEHPSVYRRMNMYAALIRNVKS
jgi:trans-aconitate methyltransferase